MNLTRTPLNIVTQFCSLMDAILPEDSKRIENSQLEYLFVFCLVWSFGACLQETDRVKFLNQLKGLTTAALPINYSLYEMLYEFNEKKWTPWEEKVGDYIPPSDGSFSKILVPTVDTERYSYLLKILINVSKPVLFVGEPGTAKTVIIQNYLLALKPEEFSVLGINFSSRTDSLEVQKNIETVAPKLRPGIYGPKGNKKLIVFIDELHMPNVDKYGTQQPIALLKLLIDKGIMYERGGDLELRHLKSTQFVSALLPPGGGFNSVDPRFLSLFNCINILFPNESIIKTIYKSILRSHLADFGDEVREIYEPITDITYQLYQ